MKLKALIFVLALLPNIVLAGSIEGSWELVKIVGPDGSVETPEDLGFGMRFDITDSTITPNILADGDDAPRGRPSPYTLEDGTIIVTWGDRQVPLCKVASQEGDSLVLLTEEESMMMGHGHNHYKRVSE